MNIHSLARSCPRSRELLVHRVLELGWSMAEAASAAGFSRRTGQKWMARYREEGRAGLEDRSSVPHRSPARTARRVEKRICRLRKQKKTGPQIAELVKMPRSTVARVLTRHGMQRLKLLEPREPARRYEKKQPGDLLHIDVKKLGRIVGGPGHRAHGDRRTRVRGAGWEYVHVCIDDHSRVAYVEHLPNERGEATAGFLRRALDWFESQGVQVKAVMTDNAFAYVHSRLFQAELKRRGIRHVRTRPYTPRTNGKAERFIQTLIREWAYARSYASSGTRKRRLQPWVEHYNRSRPHSSLGRRPPISRLQAMV